MLPPWSWLPLVLSVAFATAAVAQPPPQTFFPASVPLAIRSPYMSIWYDSSNGSTPISNSWPLFWGRQAKMDLQGSVRVDNLTYIWTGQDNPSLGGFAANLTSVRITPTRTIVVLQAGPMNVTITYLSPIEPSDWVLQSFPFSYVSFEAVSLDGRAHYVQVYSELTGEWLSNDWYGSAIRWNQYTTKSTVMHIQLQDPLKYVEEGQQARDGEAYFAMAARDGLTWQIDGGTKPRSQFHDEGILLNTSSTAFAPIAPDIVMFGIAVDLGQIQSTTSPLTWAFGYVRNPSISYTAPDGSMQELSPYYVTQYPGSDITQAIDDFTTTFSEVQQRAVALDSTILGNASAISTQYADLVSLAVRQTMGSLDITVSTGMDGKPNASDVRIFMKEIGAATPTGRVNSVEQIYAALPMLIYLNASLVGPLLSPLLDAQDGLTGQPYAAQDIGFAYPNATKTEADQSLGIEQTGNMLIMLYAHARFSGDGTLIYRHYDLATRWADYLVNNSLSPSLQRSADTEISSSANMTNLALKGIVGVKAMAEMSRALGEQSDAQSYDDHATALSASWQSLALSADGGHLLGVYGDDSSWALLYNVYADRLLGTGIVSPDLLQKQTAFYKTLLTSAPRFGLGIDSDAGHTANAAWLLFTAATVTDTGVRDDLIRGVWNRASYNQTLGPFPDAYDASTGNVVGDNANANAGPTFGAMFSLLALSVPNVTISTSHLQSDGDPMTGSGGQPGTDNGSGGHDSSTSAIAGGVVGGVTLVLLAGVGLFLFRRRRRNAPMQSSEGITSAQRYHVPLLPPTMQSVASTPVSEYYSPTNVILTPYTQNRASPLDSKTSARSLAAGPPHSPPTFGHTHVGERSPVADGPPISRATSHNGVSVSGTEVAGLRAEIDNLRRVMNDIQVDRTNDAPPEYTG